MVASPSSSPIRPSSQFPAAGYQSSQRPGGQNKWSTRGKVVLLNFWATWCGPCRAEKPILQNIYRDLKDKGFMLMAITDEDPATVRRFVNEYHIALPVFVDRTRSVFDHYGGDGLPKTVILNRQGRVVARPITIYNEGELRKVLAAAGVTP